MELDTGLASGVVSVSMEQHGGTKELMWAKLE